ncbi:MAG: hypothetical protein HY874_06575 [Chloroflexi bacterium]|nr:hypothetical protein [Chloroflexota bacterium]
MPRRIALALALAITTVVTFAVIAVGAQAGIFSADHAAKAEVIEDVPADTTAPEVPAESAEPQAPALPEPVVITEYVYVDETAVAVQAADVPSSATPKANPSARAAAPTAKASATAAAATEPAAPSATAVPAATATAPAQQQPTAPAAQKQELEFKGTVTAIDGDQVTFAHGGTTTTVRVTKNLDALSIGTKATVHALLTSSGYVAKEIAIGG